MNPLFNKIHELGYDDKLDGLVVRVPDRFFRFDYQHVIFITPTTWDDKKAVWDYIGRTLNEPIKNLNQLVRFKEELNEYKRIVKS